MNETRIKFYYKAVKCCQEKLASSSVSTSSFYVGANKPLEPNFLEVDTESICSSSFLPGALEIWVRIPSN